MIEAVEVALVTFFALLPISNPFSTVPLYLSLTRGHSKWPVFF
jgi:multiple antibiotic resistance protein